MLPDVDSQERDEVSALVAEPILVSRSAELKSTRLLVVGEPAPATTLDGRGVGIEVLDKGVSAAERTDECIA